MKKILLSLGILLSFLTGSPDVRAMDGHALPDSSVLAELDRNLVRSLDRNLTRKSFPQQFQEVKEFLFSVTDSATRQHLALKCYNYYMKSRLNGAEEVAITMTDSLFATRRIAMADEVDLMNAKIFAEFNRNSLVGDTVPVDTLYDRDMNPQVFPFQEQDRYSVLFFYSSSCMRCILDADQLKKMLEKEKAPVRLYAVYLDDSPENWKHFISTYLDIDTPEVEIHHLWDPELNSRIRNNYGILSTPKTFLLDKQNRVLGRFLDISSLKKMIRELEDLHPYVYGAEDSEEQMDRLFLPFQWDLTLQDVKYMLSRLEKKLEGDPAVLKHTVGDMMFYLCRNRAYGAAYLSGAEYIAREYVQGRPEWWTSPGDSLQIQSFATYVHELSDILPVGQPAPDMKFKGVMKSPGGVSRKGCWNLRHIGRPAYVVMYTDDCSRCKESLAAIDDFLKRVSTEDPAAGKMNFLLVDAGALERSRPRYFQKVLRQFDLSFMPFIFTVDESGQVLDKYIYL